MSRPVEELEDEMTKLWALVGDLAEQNENNRQLIVQLKTRSENVKGQAAHVGTGFPLRRFNLDISDEEFSSEIEAFSSHLVLENQQLQHENKQLNGLLKEYEQTLESVMGKFRGVAHASQQHDLSLHSYYTSLLQTLQTAHSSAHLHDNTSLSLLLHRLSTLLRSALRALGGEDEEIDLESHIPGLMALAGQTGGLGSSMLTDSAPPSPTKSASSGPKSIMRKPPQRPPVWHGSLPGASGGYIGTGGQGDWAMEREMEVLRLEDENAALREMLRIAQESIEEAIEDNPEEAVAEEEPPVASSPLAKRRKSSLTIEELQLGAEQDDEQKRKTASEPSMSDIDDMLYAKTPERARAIMIANARRKALFGRKEEDGQGDMDVPPAETQTQAVKAESALGLEPEPETSSR